MIREFKLGDLFILQGPDGKVYPRIFLNKEDAEKTNKICYDSTGKIIPAFINS